MINHYELKYNIAKEPIDGNFMLGTGRVAVVTGWSFPDDGKQDSTGKVKPGELRHLKDKQELFAIIGTCLGVSGFVSTLLNLYHNDYVTDYIYYRSSIGLNLKAKVDTFLTNPLDCNYLPNGSLKYPDDTVIKGVPHAVIEELKVSLRVWEPVNNKQSLLQLLEEIKDDNHH